VVVGRWRNRKGNVCVCVNECVCRKQECKCRGQVYQNATKSFKKAGFWRLKRWVQREVQGSKGSRSLLQPPVCASQHLKLQCSCTTTQITGMTTRVFLGRLKAGPLKCTDPTVHCRDHLGMVFCPY
jgi:hypothetical protein